MRRSTISTQPISIIRSPSFGSSPVVSVSRTICLFITGNALIRQQIRAFVLRVAGMALYPVPFHVVQRGELVEAPPQVLVLYRLLVGGAPAAPLPVEDPGRDSLLHVLRVGVEPHPARPLERLERPDHRRELHAVVRGGCFTSPQFLFLVVETQQRAPAAGAWIAAARPVAEYFHQVFSHCARARDHYRYFSGESGQAPGAARVPGATRG